MKVPVPEKPAGGPPPLLAIVAGPLSLIAQDPPLFTWTQNPLDGTAPPNSIVVVAPAMVMLPSIEWVVLVGVGAANKRDARTPAKAVDTTRMA
jgi:hypothetical protein